MFTSSKWLKIKTPPNSLGRKEFIESLVKEFHTTTNIEAQEQITANLANFAYDPINYKYLTDANALDLFILLLNSPNEKLVLHGSAGLCNICSDLYSLEEITKPQNIKVITEVFEKTRDTEVSINLLVLFYFLSCKKNLRSLIFTLENIKKIQLLKKSSEKRLVSLSTVLFEDFIIKC